MSDNVKPLYDGKGSDPILVAGNAEKTDSIKPIKFPIVHIDTAGNADTKEDIGFGVEVTINGEKVVAPQKCVIEAAQEEFSMVTLTFPAIIK